LWASGPFSLDTPGINSIFIISENPQKGRKMKIPRRLLALGLMILVCAMVFGCSKKVLRTDAPSGASWKGESRASEPRPQAQEEKAGAVSPQASVDLEREKRLREEALREQALREKALKEEADRKKTSAQEAAKKLKIESVFFDYDQWNIREDQKEAMAQNAEWLKANPKTKIQIAGNCDERGTAEYNLALGQKRAESVKKYLEGLGVSGDRVNTISYGLERPLDPGHNEAAWAKNRRADFVPVK
jgi:peptidoglycan-associated lipoprotein